METQGITNGFSGTNPSSLMDFIRSRQASKAEKTKVVSEQFESLLVKQFLNDALKPMFKGVFDENTEGHRFYRHFFTDALSESIAQGGGFGMSSILQQQLGDQASSTSSEPSPEND